MADRRGRTTLTRRLVLGAALVAVVVGVQALDGVTVGAATAGPAAQPAPATSAAPLTPALKYGMVVKAGAGGKGLRPVPPRHPLAGATPHLSYFGGPVVSHAEVRDVFWGGGTYGTNAGPGGQMPSFFNAVGSSDWFAWLTQYETAGLAGGSDQVIQPAVSAGETALTPAPANDGATITDAEEQAELAADFANGTLPAPTTDYSGNTDSVYALFMPAGKTLQGPAGTGTGGVQWCAYHNTFTYNGVAVPYMVLPAFTAGSNYAAGCGTAPSLYADFTSTVSHELAETVTDPDVGLDTQSNYAYPAAWGDNSNGEIGDICDTGSAALEAGFYVQALWSNQYGQCAYTEPYRNITPAIATVPIGASQTYSVTGPGGTDLTSLSTFSATAPTTCAANVCSPHDGTTAVVTAGGAPALLWATTPLLTVTSVTGSYGVPLTLTTSGPGSGTQPVTFSVVDGTATGCTVSGTGPHSLSSTSPGTCTVTAIQATDEVHPATTSLPTTVSLNGTQCEPGSYSGTGLAPCSPAPPGSYVDSVGATSATACPAGTYAPNPGSAACLAADPGSYVSSTGASGETPCAAGSFSSTPGATACSPAPLDSYVASTGATSATACPAGTFTLTPGATSVSACLYVAVATTSLPKASVFTKANHAVYSATLAATGGAAHDKWTLASGSGPLPPGLKLKKGSGVISGKAKTAGTYTFTVQVAYKTASKPHVTHTATAVLSITVS